MLYESTKNLLQSILWSLETGDENRFDDQTESGNSCLYEMHQMSKSLYKPYKSDGKNATALAQGNLPGKLTRAIPHVRTMVIAIRHKDEAQALESGRAALAEMNGTSRSNIPGECAEPTTATARKEEKPTRKDRLSLQAVSSGV
jgi:hypothetical protein